MFKGSMVALVTPMLESGEVAYEQLLQLVEWHITAGTQAIVVYGTTGEAPTLTQSEKNTILQKVHRQAAGRVAVIAGTGSNATSVTIEATRQAMDNGANACLIVTPYYNKPTQEGLYLHHLAIADAVPIPQFLYNVPGRTGCDMLPETVIRLASHPNIIGVKEATAKLERVGQLRAACPSDFLLLSGDDATARDFILQGGDGVISVTANVAPALMQALCIEALAGNAAAAQAIDEKLSALHQDLFLEANPIPVKWALGIMGLISAGIRLPLTPLSLHYHTAVQQALLQADIALPRN